MLAVLLLGLSCPAQPDSAETVTASDLKQRAEELQRAEDMKKFGLYNGCLPMSLLVENLPPNAEEVGLTKEAIQNALESRLRASRLYLTPENKPKSFARAKLLFSSLSGEFWETRLYARVSLFNRSFSIELKYEKYVPDSLSGFYAYATTWEKSMLGTSDKDAGYILNGLAELTDMFLVEYLRANEADC